MNTKQKLLARRANHNGKSTFAYPPARVGARMADGMQWIEDGAIRERHRVWADDVNKYMRHCGWYCDQYSAFPDDGGTLRGRIIMLSHGRFIAGYAESGEDLGTCVDVGRLFTCEYEAAQHADDCARVAAERESEYRQEERERTEREEREAELDLAHAESDFAD